MAKTTKGAGIPEFAGLGLPSGNIGGKLFLVKRTRRNKKENPWPLRHCTAAGVLKPSKT
jgi:hypothetical protein